MKRFVSKDGLIAFWVANDHIDTSDISEEEQKAILASHGESLFRGLDQLEKEYLELYKKSVGRQRTAILIAHGNGRPWCYFDGDSSNTVQSWVSQREREKFGVIALCCCNPYGETPKVNKALLVLPDRTFSEARLSLAMVRVDIVHPTEGELGSIIEYALQELKSTVT